MSIFTNSNKNLRVISYNCESFNRNSHMIKLLLNECDILLLQETLLCDHSLDVFQSLHDEFSYYAVSAVRSENVFVGKSSGGLCVLYRKSFANYIKPFYCTSRIMGISLQNVDFSLLLLNVYLPCDYKNDDSFIAYQSALTDIDNICTDLAFDKIIIAGDMNCDPNKGRFFRIFNNVMQDLSLSVVDVDRFGNTDADDEFDRVR